MHGERSQAPGMGAGWSRGLRAMSKANERRVLLLGLDGAGKTTCVGCGCVRFGVKHLCLSLAQASLPHGTR